MLSDGRREMMDDDQWAWVTEQVTGDYDHVLLANTLPVLLAPTLHYVEAWNEAVCRGAWGRWATGWSEKLRRALDLEHWAAFGNSFVAMADLVAEIGSGTRGKPPATVIFLSGDVHFSYGATAKVRDRTDLRSVVVQAMKCVERSGSPSRRVRRMWC